MLIIIELALHDALLDLFAWTIACAVAAAIAVWIDKRTEIFR